MQRVLTLILLSLISVYSSGQSLYTELNETNFREYPLFNEAIVIDQFNATLLNACIFHASNEIRAKKKLNILSYHPKLEEAADMHSEDMVVFDFFSHTNRKNKERREPNDRAKLVGIETPYIAENIIEGFILEYESGNEVVATAPGQFINYKTRDTLQVRTYLELTDSILDMWMKSEGHRKNILSKDALQLGCGSSLTYMREFNDMPIVRATQCFQWFVGIPE